MKSMLFSIFAFMILFVSCAADSMEEPTIGNTVNFNISVADGGLRTRSNGNTRAYADGSSVNNLKCYVYNTALDDDALPVRTETIELRNLENHRGATFSLDLPNKENYDVVFIATSCPQDDDGSKVYYKPSERSINLNYDKIQANDEEVDCFFGVVKGASSEKQTDYSVVLKRPFAQLNIGTKDMEDYNRLSAAPLQTTGVTVDGVYSVMNVMDGSVSGNPENIMITPSALPDGQTFPVNGAEYLSMNYLLVNERKDVNVTITTSNGSQSIDTEITEVPLQRNYQTNVYGNILTKKNDFTVEINPEFENSIIQKEDYDLILTAVNRATQLLLYTYDRDGNETIFNLRDYLDSNLKVKIHWADLNLSKAKQIKFKNDGIISIEKCDINSLGCTDLSEIFYGCHIMSSVDAIKEWDVSNVTDMSKMFFNCNKLRVLDLSNFDTSNVRSMESMFYNCSGLTSLDLSNFDTSKVTDMKYMFYQCLNLASLDLSNFNTFNVTDMAYMFFYCKGLKSLDLSNFDIDNVRSMACMFFYCKGLKSLDLSNFKGNNLTSCWQTFRECSNLQSLIIDNLNTSKVTDMQGMFDECSSLKSLDLSNFDTSKVSRMNSMFSECSMLETLDISNFNTSKVTDMSYMFRNCKKLTTIDVSNFDTSKVTNMLQMFYHTDNVSSLDVSNFDTSNVTDMKEMFVACNTSSLDVSHFNTAKVTNMESMFSGCSNVTKIDVSNFDTSNVISMESMFGNCKEITELNLSNFDTNNVTDMGLMFCNCSKIEHIIFPNINGAGKLQNMQDIFYNDPLLDYIDISNSNFMDVDLRRSFYSENIKTIIGPIYGINSHINLNTTKLSNESAMVFINGLVDTTDEKVIYFHYDTYHSLTDEQIKMASDKGWRVTINN